MSAARTEATSYALVNVHGYRVTFYPYTRDERNEDYDGPVVHIVKSGEGMGDEHQIRVIEEARALYADLVAHGYRKVG